MARPRLSSSGVRRASATASLALACLSGCSGDLINLGSSELLSVGGDAATGGTDSGGGGTATGGLAAREWSPEAEPVLTPEDGYSYANGTLTSELVLFFTKQERGEPKVLLFQAQPAGARWSEAAPLSFEGVTIEDAASPAISLEGDELWFGSMGGEGATDIWRSTPSADTWSMPEAFGPPLNSTADDVPRPLAVGKTIMPLSSKRDGEQYRIYLAKRAAPSAPWDSVSADQLASVNAADESVDGFLTENGLTLYFASKRAGHADADLYRASRADLDSAFGEPTALTGLQSTADERDPWLTEDGNTLYYSSNRTGLYATYRARRIQ